MSVKYSLGAPSKLTPYPIDYKVPWLHDCCIISGKSIELIKIKKEEDNGSI